MRKIHPRTAGATFGLIYYLIGAIISLIFHLNLFKYKIYIGIGVAGALIIATIFGKEYYKTK